jgi:hypothetical protein
MRRIVPVSDQDEFFPGRICGNQREPQFRSAHPPLGYSNLNFLFIIDETCQEQSGARHMPEAK